MKSLKHFYIIPLLVFLMGICPVQAEPVVSWSSVYSSWEQGTEGQSATNINPELALSRNGDIAIAIWAVSRPGYNSIVSSTAAVTGNVAVWTSPTTLARSGPNGYVRLPRIKISGDGYLATAIWDESDGIVPHIASASAVIYSGIALWGGKTYLPNTVADFRSPELSLSRDGGTATVVWYQSDSNGRFLVASSSGKITGSNAVWGNPSILSDNDKSAICPIINASADGSKITVLWEQMDGSIPSIQSAAGTTNGSHQVWGNPVQVYGLGGNNIYCTTRFALSDDGSKAAAIWQNYPTGNAIQTASATISSSSLVWGGITTLSSQGVSPEIALSLNGLRATSVWSSHPSTVIYSIVSASAVIDGNTQAWGVNSTLSGVGIVAGGANLAQSDDGSKVIALWYRQSSGTRQYQSAAASVVGGILSWGQGVDISSPSYSSNNGVPKILLSSNGTKATALWDANNMTWYVPRTASATISYPTETYLLTALSTSNGSITSNPSGIDCGNTCSASFNSGTSVTLTATPNSGYTFSGWSGACTGAGSCVVTMNSNQSVGASFALSPYLLSVSSAGNGSITSNPSGIDCGNTCSASFNSGTSVTLTATPNSGYTFSGWTGACSGTGTCVVTMNSNQSVGAGFAPIQIYKNLTVTTTGSGSVLSSPSGISCGSICNSYYLQNTPVTLFATPAQGYVFSHWSGACVGIGGCTVSMYSDQSVTATFTQAPNVTLSASINGKGSIADFSGQGITCGSTCSFSYPVNSMVTLVAIPQTGNSFTGWSGGCTGRGDCTLWMGANQSVSGTFVNTYVLIQPAIQLLLQ